MRMVNISNEKSMQSYTARCSRYKNKYTNLVCGKTAVGRNYNLPRDNIAIKCGYDTTSTFNRNFKNITGVTPYQLKKNAENYESKLLKFHISAEKGW